MAHLLTYNQHMSIAERLDELYDEVDDLLLAGQFDRVNSLLQRTVIVLRSRYSSEEAERLLSGL